jgi:tetratricopeptide (TPR) repeat protein
VLCAPAIAHAEDPTKTYPDCGREPTEAEVAAAKGAFQAGNASFNEADYARAIDYWEDAYRRDCTANPLLLNLARAYELAGRKRQAVVALETFLAREPNSGEKDQINRRVEVLKKKIAEEDAAAASAPANNGASSPPVGGTTTSLPPEEAPPQRAKRSAGPWIVIGVGGAVTIVGAIGYASAKQKMDDAAAKCGDGGRGMCMNDQAVTDGNDARKALTTSGVVMGVGGLAVLGGFVWWWFDGQRVESAQAVPTRRTALYPVLSPELAGVGVSGSF